MAEPNPEIAKKAAEPRYKVRASADGSSLRPLTIAGFLRRDRERRHDATRHLGGPAIANPSRDYRTDNLNERRHVDRKIGRRETKEVLGARRQKAACSPRHRAAISREKDRLARKEQDRAISDAVLRQNSIRWASG
jgi:hypothetical protein